MARHELGNNTVLKEEGGEPVLENTQTGVTVTLSDYLAVSGGGIGTDADPIPGTSHFESVNTEISNSVRQVPEFGTLQAAHDDLPENGGEIKLTEPVAESDIVFDKPIKLTGAGTEFSGSTQQVEIDVSGGDGLWAKKPVFFEDIHITGDGATGTFGLKIGEDGVYAPGYSLRNVSVRGVSGDGVLITGEQTHGYFDVITKDTTGHGVHCDLSGSNYVSACHFPRLIGHRIENGASLRISGDVGQEFMGNTVGQFWSEFSQEGINIDDGIRFEGNGIRGYGIEAADTAFNIGDLNGRGDNRMRLRTVDAASFGTLNQSLFSELNASLTPNLVGTETPELDNYLFDDFADNGFSNRTGSQTGQYPDPSLGPSKNYRGYVRPRWRSAGGSPTVSNGELVLPPGDTTTQIAVAENIALETGTWEFDFQFSSTPGFSHRFDFIREDGSNVWFIESQSGGGFVLKKYEAGALNTVISGSWSPDTSPKTCKVTRDESGNWELFVNGTSQGTATDTFLPDGQRIRVVNQNTSELTVSEIRFH